MPESTDPVAQKLLEDLEDVTLSHEERSNLIKTLKTYVEAQKLLEPDPMPEPSGVRGFFHRHAGDLIKAGSTLSIVAVIAVIEAKGDVIFRSKASKFI